MRSPAQGVVMNIKPKGFARSPPRLAIPPAGCATIHGQEIPSLTTLRHAHSTQDKALSRARSPPFSEEPSSPHKPAQVHNSR
jgi:hypothetical protein